MVKSPENIEKNKSALIYIQSEYKLAFNLIALTLDLSGSAKHLLFRNILVGFAIQLVYYQVGC